MDVDKMINYEKILNIKFNDDEYTISNAFNYDTIVWLSERNEKPTKELLDFKYNCLQDAELKYCYKQRIENYPAISDQLDALFHAGVFPAEMAEQIQVIKINIQNLRYNKWHI